MTADSETYAATFGEAQRRTLARVTFIATLTEDPRVERVWRSWYEACLEQLPEMARASAGDREYFEANPEVRSMCAQFFIAAQPALLVMMDDAVSALQIPGNPSWITELLFLSTADHGVKKLIGIYLPLGLRVHGPPITLPISTTPEDAVAQLKAAQGTLLTREEEADEIETGVRWFYKSNIQQPPTSKRLLARQYFEQKRRRGEHLGSIPTSLVRHRIAKARKLLGIPEGEPEEQIG